MNYYEVLYIVNPNYGKDKISEIINGINTHIESKKHSILNHNFWGKKQLAYSVNKEKYGNYVLLHAEFSNSSFVADCSCLKRCSVVDDSIKNFTYSGFSGSIPSNLDTS